MEDRGEASRTKRINLQLLTCAGTPDCRSAFRSVRDALYEDCLKKHGSVEDRMRTAKFLRNWVVGPHGVGTWHGAGPRQNQMIALCRDIELEKKQTARELVGMGD